MNLILKKSEELEKEAFELPVSVYRPGADEPQKFTLVCEELDQPAMEKIMKQPRVDFKLLTRGSFPRLRGTLPLRFLRVIHKIISRVSE